MRAITILGSFLGSSECQNSWSLGGSSCRSVPFCHFTCDCKDNLFIPFAEFLECLKKPAFLRTQLSSISWASGLRLSFTREKELIKLDIKCSAQLFKRFEVREDLSVFKSGDIATQKPSSFFDITL